MSLQCFLPGEERLKLLAIPSAILGRGEPVNPSSDPVFWNCATEHLSVWTKVAEASLATQLQARDAGLKVDPRRQDAESQPGGSSLLPRLMSSPSELIYPDGKVPEAFMLGMGRGVLLIFRL